ncbi:MAG: phenylalanine--tRNA ligase subunit alpha [Bacteroidetes bacterium]|nr:phenylalanine--tRNA ligase subunit alpha [Bacteroidota bacterium]
MQDKIRKHIADIETFTCQSAEELEKFRIHYLGKKGILAELFSAFKNVSPESRKETGQLLNELKDAANGCITRMKESLGKPGQGSEDAIDLTLPVDDSIGSRHPLSITRNRITEIFSRIGFSVEEGPEIESDRYNFGALNFPVNHPARDMQDTFFIEKDPDILLRTHTSSVQIRYMEKHPPPIRSIFPGRVFRNEAISARAHCIFHQVEGLAVDKDVSFADLKQTLLYFAREMFGPQTQIRLRPSFFPFTEPSAELDISCNICGGKGCNICKHTGWVEILGCGMVHPIVLENCGIDSQKNTGYAFGMGIERIAMLKYLVRDIRLYFENDIRFLKQFGSAF